VKRSRTKLVAFREGARSTNETKEGRREKGELDDFVLPPFPRFFSSSSRQAFSSDSPTMISSNSGACPHLSLDPPTSIHCPIAWTASLSSCSFEASFKRSFITELDRDGEEWKDRYGREGTAHTRYKVLNI